MRTEKGKGSRTPIFSREPCPRTIIKNMIIISRYEVEYKKEEDIFNKQYRRRYLPMLWEPA